MTKKDSMHALFLRLPVTIAVGKYIATFLTTSLIFNNNKKKTQFTIDQPYQLSFDRID